MPNEFYGRENMYKELITVKGTRNGLVFYFNTRDASFKELQDVLAEKLQSSGGFFAGAKFIISADNELDVEQAQAMEAICIQHGMEKGSPSKPVFLGAQAAAKYPGDDYTEYYHTMNNSVLISKSLRSGQKVYVTGHAIIAGDVNPGAEVVATGSIIVLGTFRGLAHAGAHGDQSTYVMAYRLQPVQIGIADKLSRAPESGAFADYPEIALVVDNRIVIEPYRAAKRKAASL
jgi:septum site-determining protein MinC